MPTPKPRGTRSPRNSGSPEEGGNNNQDTTITTVMDIAGDPFTPSRFIATPSAIRSASRRTPRGALSTPFGLRAIQRRAANTPGRDRRRSGKIQRETPFDILKNLGRALAPVSQSIRSSPQEQPEPPPKDETDYLDEEPVPERPRLSLPVDEDTGTIEDGSPDMSPPRLSLAFDEEDITQRSIEYPRRAMSEQDRARLSRMSFGDVRMSENFGDLSRLSGMDETGDFTTLQQGNDDEAQEDTTLGPAAFDAGGETEDLGRFNLEFNFPTPRGPDEAEPDLGLAHDEEDFMLDAGAEQIEQGFPSSDQDAAAAGSLVRFDINIPDHISEAGTAGIVGGGLRNEPFLRGRREKKLSQHGILVPNLPSGVVKRLAMRFARTGTGVKTKISRDTLAAIEQASDWFFEQAGEDLATYAKHAGRKTIDESDVMTLMRRQRHINSSNTVFSLAQKHLPKELLQDMRLSLPR